MSDPEARLRLLCPDVSRETSELLRTHHDLLRKWSARINLVARSTLDDAWERHIIDSAQVHALAGTRAGHWADLGSGAGFPGMVVAILAAGSGLRVTLVESDQRKCAFLGAVARATGVPVTILAERIEALPALGADILSARALAPLDDLLGMAERHLKPGGKGFFPKGLNHLQEIDTARRRWAFSLRTHPSITDPKAVILEIGDIRRV